VYIHRKIKQLCLDFSLKMWIYYKTILESKIDCFCCLKDFKVNTEGGGGKIGYRKPSPSGRSGKGGSKWEQEWSREVLCGMFHWFKAVTFLEAARPTVPVCFGSKYFCKWLLAPWHFHLEYHLRIWPDLKWFMFRKQDYLQLPVVKEQMVWGLVAAFQPL
jgi:hypothetical protein